MLQTYIYIVVCWVSVQMSVLLYWWVPPLVHVCSLYVPACRVSKYLCKCALFTPSRALVSRLRGGHRHRASLGWSLKHAGMEACMSPGMFSQVVTPHEALVTHWTVEAFLPGVCAIVTGELVWSGELLTTAGPGAFKWPLTSVHP